MRTKIVFHVFMWYTLHFLFGFHQFDDCIEQGAAEPAALAYAAALRLARRTRAIVRQNLAWALGYNIVAVPLAAAGLVTPWVAALGMALSSLIVTVNALRLARIPDR